MSGPVRDAGAVTAGPRPPEVLFVGHEATRTGAPLMLLHFLRWLRAETDLSFEIVLLDGGPLVAEFREVAPTRVLADLRDSGWSRRLERYRLGGLASVLRSVVARRWCAPYRRIPLVYCNSIRAIRILGLLGGGSRTVVSHVHELELAISVSTAPAERELLLTRPDRYVAASDLVKQNLVDNHGLDPDRIARHYEFIDVAAFTPGPSTGLADLRRDLGIPSDAAVVGAVGVAEPRKAPDLFLQLALELRRRDLGRPVHLVWVGAEPEADGTRWMAHDIGHAGLGDLVHVVGSQASPARFFELFDVLALTSREDPFPLVCLESSLLGTPILCFPNTGMAEFVGDDENGVVVPYLDLHAMADAIEDLLADPARLEAMGARASVAVRDHHDVTVGAPALYADLRAWLAEAPGA